jgi:hypothetical protein
MRLACAVALFSFFLTACPGTNNTPFLCPAEKCLDGYSCYSVTSTCKRTCTDANAATVCLASEECVDNPGATDKVCLPSTTGPDTGGGDSAGGDPATGD